MSPKNRNRGISTGVALLCTAVFMTTGATAAPSSSNEIAIRYVKADLARPGAAESLYRQIQQAARRVCHEPGWRDLALYTQFQQCYEHAIDAAVAKVDATALTALHRSKTQRTAAG